MNIFQNKKALILRDKSQTVGQVAHLICLRRSMQTAEQMKAHRIMHEDTRFFIFNILIQLKRK